jgi:ribosomal protein L11 methyltransferase
MEPIEKHIFQYISQSTIKISFGTLRRNLAEEFSLTRTEVKKIVSKLIQKGILCYTSHFGNVYIEPSYDKAVLISKNVVIKPSSITYRPRSGETVLKIDKGSSFGCGSHPSTRLAIRLIDDAFSNYSWKIDLQDVSALDIGTGSGVLAILAAKLGVGFVCAVDTDPCAMFESKYNVIQNSLEKKVRIIEGDLEVVEGTYSIVLANLRFPTLIALRKSLEKVISENGFIILSGIKKEEVNTTAVEYEKSGLFLMNQLTEQEWSAVSLCRGDLVHPKR